MFDTYGCGVNVPAAYAPGVFESCLGDDQLPVKPGVTDIPASSQCTPAQSVQLYTALVSLPRLMMRVLTVRRSRPSAAPAPPPPARVRARLRAPARPPAAVRLPPPPTRLAPLAARMPVCLAWLPSSRSVQASSALPSSHERPVANTTYRLIQFSGLYFCLSMDHGQHHISVR